MANTYISRTFGTPTNSAIWTFSVWFKRSKISATMQIFTAGSGATDQTRIGFTGSDFLNVNRNIGGSEVELLSTKKFRDTNGWYHLVVQNNSGTAAVYVNGVAVSLNSSSLGTNKINVASTIHIVGDTPASGENFDGIMSHIHFVDGTIYAPTVFGSTDSTTGEWQINTFPSITMGNNGFTILKDGNTITDQSSNSNNFSASSGTLTKTEDNPSNVFCTMNPLNHDYANTDSDIYYGNTLVYPRDNTNYTYAMSTMAMPKGNGKFYFEAKFLTYDNIENGVGIVNIDYASDIFYQNRQIMSNSANTEIGRVLLNANGRSIIPGTENSSYGFGSWSNGDIICMACDMENGAFYFRKNGGSWANSGDPTSGSTKTGAIDISSTSQWTSSFHWGVWCGCNENNHDRFAFNFGNGSFGNTSGYSSTPTITSTAVSSAGANASGNGIFEYDVPTGYTALSTKGLNL